MFERGHSYQFHLVFICVSLKLELGWVKVGRGAKLKKDPEVHRTMHRTLSRCVRCGESAGLHSPDAGTVSLQRPVMCVRCSARRALGHRTLRPASGDHRPVVCRFENFFVFAFSAHRTRPVPHKERPVTLRSADITPNTRSVRPVFLLPVFSP